jgi:D-sedoheptulose 7-phosphate isomerase
MSVVAVTGADAGKLGALADVTLNVPARRTCHVQEMHIAVGHMICFLAEKAVAGQELPQ